ncbi:ran-specific GTPase-activating protein [Amia ocellicauda]|uniref:ran-specific GTPase-activating protein n=1 Tax=Amia ocellicauda TaxID=2972642 RepID=UPI003463BC25
MADTKETPEEPEPTTENTEDTNHDPHFEPIVSLPEQEVKTLEEDEEELFKMRAKLYRFASENDPPEWKERGTGDVKLLKHKEKGTIRLLMRRDRTLKICANHNIAPLMELRPNAGSDRAWVWNTHADFADEHPKPEMLAIRFLNAENAQKFKAKFDECKEEVRKSSGNEECADKVAEKLEELSVKEEKSKQPSDHKGDKEPKKEEAENAQGKDEEKQ